jgi:hypothetical protein
MRFLLESLKAAVATGVAVVGWLLLFVVPPPMPDRERV